MARDRARLFLIRSSPDLRASFDACATSLPGRAYIWNPTTEGDVWKRRRATTSRAFHSGSRGSALSCRTTQRGTTLPPRWSSVARCSPLASSRTRRVWLVAWMRYPPFRRLTRCRARPIPKLYHVAKCFPFEREMYYLSIKYSSFILIFKINKLTGTTCTFIELFRLTWTINYYIKKIFENTSVSNHLANKIFSRIYIFFFNFIEIVCYHWSRVGESKTLISRSARWSFESIRPDRSAFLFSV